MKLFFALELAEEVSHFLCYFSFYIRGTKFKNKVVKEFDDTIKYEFIIKEQFCSTAISDLQN